jgi:hypothetical protein
MQHYTPRKRLDGRYDYTAASGQMIWPVGYCHPYKPWQPEDLRWLGDPEEREAEALRLELKQAPWCFKYHGTGHETPEEAVECYRQYLLDQELRFYQDSPEADTQHRCAECQAWTSGWAEVGYGIGRLIHLCADHRVRWAAEKHYARSREAWSS